MRLDAGRVRFPSGADGDRDKLYSAFHMEVTVMTLFDEKPKRETTTLADLIRMSRSWYEHDIPISILIDGIEFPLDFRYCSTSGVVFQAPNGLPLSPPIDAEAVLGTPVEKGPRARASDPSTSHRAAASVKYRAGSQKALLVQAYRRAEGPLTDDEAAHHAGLLAKPGCCWWHRCSDLREDGVIERVGERKSTTGRTNEVVMVCTLTAAGRALAEPAAPEPTDEEITAAWKAGELRVVGCDADGDSMRA